MIGGFIITGIQPKTVIVRGIGPSLPVPGALADPVIEVHGSAGELTATNDNWRDGTYAAQVANTLPPANDLESALWGILDPGAYTVVVRGNNNATGIGFSKCTIWIKRSIPSWPTSRRAVSLRQAIT